MSSIQTFPQAVSQSGKGRIVDQRSAIVPQIGSDKPQPKDQVIMHAWSIGVTNAARMMVPAARQEEECPPEVYIG